MQLTVNMVNKDILIEIQIIHTLNRYDRKNKATIQLHVNEDGV